MLLTDPFSFPPLRSASPCLSIWLLKQFHSFPDTHWRSFCSLLCLCTSSYPISIFGFLHDRENTVFSLSSSRIVYLKNEGPGNLRYITASKVMESLQSEPAARKRQEDIFCDERRIHWLTQSRRNMITFTTAYLDTAAGEPWDPTTRTQETCSS